MTRQINIISQTLSKATRTLPFRLNFTQNAMPKVLWCFPFGCSSLFSSMCQQLNSEPGDTSMAEGATDSPASIVKNRAWPLSAQGREFLEHISNRQSIIKMFLQTWIIIFSKYLHGLKQHIKIMLVFAFLATSLKDFYNDTTSAEGICLSIFQQKLSLLESLFRSQELLG